MIIIIRKYHTIYILGIYLCDIIHDLFVYLISKYFQVFLIAICVVQWIIFLLFVNIEDEWFLVENQEACDLCNKIFCLIKIKSIYHRKKNMTWMKMRDKLLIESLEKCNFLLINSSWAYSISCITDSPLFIC